MKNKKLIIAIVAVLIIVGIAVGVYFSTKSDSSSTTTGKTYASNGRSGSLLERLNAEIESGAYGSKSDKNNGSESAQEGVA